MTDTPAAAAYQEYVCPTGCGRTERAGKAPFYSACPGCNQSAGRYVPKPPAATVAAKAPARKGKGAK